MKPSTFLYHRPSQLQEALALLETLGADAKVIAGGQSLVPAMNLRLSSPSALVDLSAVKALKTLSLDGPGRLKVGAMVTHARMLHETSVTGTWPLFSHVLPYVAHEAVRNRGTIGGSISHADPAAEWPALCLMLDASIRVESVKGSREVPAESFTLGVYETALEPGEIVTEILFPKHSPSARFGFHEISRRRGDFAMAGAMVRIELDAHQRLEELRLVVFAVEDRPRRLDSDLSMFIGNCVDEANIENIALAAAAAVDPRADLHASSELRVNLVYACVQQSLRSAMQAFPSSNP